MASNWTIKRTSNPSELPLSLAEVKAHLRLNQNDPTHDENLNLLIEAAVERLQQDLDRQFITSTYEQTQFSWVDCEQSSRYGDEVKIQKKAVTAVSAVTYVDEDGAEQTLDPSAYVFDSARGSLFPTPGTQWPSVQSDNPNAVKVAFTAGYGVDNACIPRLFKAALLLCIGKWFFDPAQEGSALHSQEVAYERIVALLMRSSYP